MSMQDTFLYFLSMLVESIALSCCILAVFRDQKDLRKRDFILVPSVSLCLLIARSSYGGASPGFHLTQGFFLAPADNCPILLILLMGLLLLTSTLLNTQDGGRTFCGTMAAFSLYLLCHFCAVIFASLFNLTSAGIAVVSSAVTLLLCIFVVCMPWFQGLRSALRTGSFLVQILSINVTLFFAAVCARTSFDPIRFMAHWKFIAFLLLPLLFLDIVLWMINSRQEEQRKQIRMTEQYVPIVEELISQVRARQHEFNNRMMAIEAAVSSAESLPEAQEAVALLTKGLVLSANDSMLLACDSKIISGFVFGKIKQAEISGLDIRLQISTSFKKTSIPETVWIELIGILLDNALEASKQGETIYLESCQAENVTELWVCNPHPPLSGTEFMRLFAKGVSTKVGNSRGYGLYQLVRITEHYRGKILTRNEIRSDRNYVVFGVRFS